MPTLPSTNMLLPVPVVGVDPGPDYAINVNDCFFILDNHDHAPGKGVLITPAGLNINLNLTFNNNSAVNLKSANFTTQLAAITTSRSLYMVNDDLYFTDGNGISFPLTSQGAVAGSPGSIGNLNPPASCTFNALSSTFVFAATATAAANISAADVILKNTLAPFNSVTLKAPLALPASYTFTYPSVLPPVQSFATIDGSGTLAAPWTVDNFSIEVASGTTIQLKDLGTTLGKLAAAVQQALVPAGTILPYGGINPPAGYLLCNGDTPARSAYPALFAATSINFTTVTRNGTATLTIGGGQDPQVLGVRPGMGLSGTGIPTNAIVSSVSPTTIVMNVSAVGSGTDTVDICFFGAGNGTTTFSLPDLRGQFLRGVDFTAAKDPDASIRTRMSTNGNTGNNVGSIQSDNFRSHTHTYTFQQQNHSFEDEPGPLAWEWYSTQNTGATGGNETRPTNAYVNYIIKT